MCREYHSPTYVTADGCSVVIRRRALRSPERGGYHQARRRSLGWRQQLNRIDLAGRVAAITGGAQGIGYAIAERLMRSGAAVALWDRDGRQLEAAQQSLGEQERILGCVVDVTRLDQVESAVTATAAWGGAVDILVCNAGITGPTVPLWQYPPAEWQRVLDVDLTGVFNCMRAVVPSMVERNYGRICSIASIAGKEGNPNASAYSAAKAGVIALTKSLGKELAAHDIAVSCVTPAAARTNIFAQMSQSHIDYMLSKIPRGRFAEVDEIAAMVAWLVSGENSFTTGAVFDLSGGRATY